MNHFRRACVFETLDRRVLLSDIAGLWQGLRSEAGLSGTFAQVDIQLNLTQSGEKVSGTEVRSSAKDSEYFTNLHFHGSVVGSTLFLQDDSITAQEKPSNYKWLLYTATLSLSADGQTMGQ